VGITHQLPDPVMKKIAAFQKAGGKVPVDDQTTAAIPNAIKLGVKFNQPGHQAWKHRQLTANYPGTGRAMIDYHWSPFTGGLDAISLTSADDAGLAKAIEQFEQIVDGRISPAVTEMQTLARNLEAVHAAMLPPKVARRPAPATFEVPIDNGKLTEARSEPLGVVGRHRIARRPPPVRHSELCHRRHLAGHLRGIRAAGRQEDLCRQPPQSCAISSRSTKSARIAARLRSSNGACMILMALTDAKGGRRFGCRQNLAIAPCAVPAQGRTPRIRTASDDCW